MTSRTKKYLSDILAAVELIESFLLDITSFEEYQNDLKTQSAVERQLSIVGEAVAALRNEQPPVLLMHTQQIAGFRNRLIHAYDSIDNAVVWVIVKRHLPELKRETTEMLAS